jgi:nitrate/TMAO reductase-like tetraheme cytochrome c subunit
VLRRTAVAALLLATPAAALAADGMPRPEGWIGTTTQWVQALGVGFAVINLILLALAWRAVRRGELPAATKQALAVSVVVLPIAVVFFGYQYGLEASRAVDACGSCHVMQGHVQDLRNVKSDTLAAVHFKNRYIQEDHCYVCHSDYGMAGTVKAKLAGLGHVWHYTTGNYEQPLKIARPYPNTRCLYCHGASQKFLDQPAHPKDALYDLLTGGMSCLDCHGPAHPRAAQKSDR